ncbi:MAG: cytochrome c biogenesis protein CcsA [Pseudomonadota bacterium]
MGANLVALGAITLYLTASVQTASSLRAPAVSASKTPLLLTCAIAALLLHGSVVYSSAVDGAAIDLGIWNAASLVGWFVAAFAIVFSLVQTSISLGLVVFPLAAITVATGAYLGNSPPSTSAMPAILAVHIALSLVAYSLFAVAALEALFLAFADKRLRTHQPIIGFLPGIGAMERLLFQLTAIAFALLTVGILIGTLQMHDMLDQHLSHKIFFSLLAWLVFAALLIGRFKFHWRGPRASKYVLTGFALLAVGFFGSKIVLELVLGRT